MTKNSYYVEYYRDFGNTYNLWYAPKGTPVPESFEKITRKEAIRLCTDERWRRAYDQAFSGYADTYIYPYLAEHPKRRDSRYWDNPTGYIVPMED